jgi:hypothetical protein
LTLAAAAATCIALDAWTAARAAEPGAITLDVPPAVVTTATKLLQARGASSPATIKGYPLPDGRTATVVLQAFPLWADAAEISIRAGKQTLGAGRPRSTVQLLGRIENGTSTVQLRLTADGLAGFAFYKGRLYRQTFGAGVVTFEPLAATAVGGSEPGAACVLDGAAKAEPALGAVLKSAPALGSMAGTGLVLDPQPKPGAVSTKFSVDDYLATLDPVKTTTGKDVLGLGFCCIGGPGGRPVKFFDVAVETDDELGVEYSGHFGLLQSHVEDVMAAVNAIYWSGDTGVIFRLRWLLIHWGMAVGEEVQDPYSGGPFARLTVLRHLWTTDSTRVAMTQVNRDVTLLMSGRVVGGNSIYYPWDCVENGQSTGQPCNVPGGSCGTNGGTCQWVGESLCRQDRAFAIIEKGDFDTRVNATAHELGHLFGVEHAHCTDTRLPASAPPVAPVDGCEVGRVSMRNEACHAGPAQSPPGLLATVMSTCPALYNGILLSLEFHARSAEILSDAAQAAACGKPATVVELQNGQAVQGLQSTSVEQYHYFAIEVPPGTGQLSVQTSGQGALGLYVRYGTLPTTWGTLVSNAPGTASQVINQAAPRAGWWYVLLLADTQFSGVELRAQYQ